MLLWTELAKYRESIGVVTDERIFVKKRECMIMLYREGEREDNKRWMK